MTDEEDNIILGKIVFDDNNQEIKSRACLGKNCSRSIIVFLSQLFVVLLIIFGCIGEFISQKLVLIQLFGLEFCVVQQDTFYLHQDYEQVNFCKNRFFISMVGLSETGKSKLIYNWLKNGTFQPEVYKIYFFSQRCQKLYDVMQNKLKFSSLFKV